MDFSLIMFVLLVATGLIWGLDRAILARRRKGESREPVIVEYSRAFFPVILIVFLLRSFLVEPFRIPSGSMMPTLYDGDFILVNKYTYGVRIPVVNHKVMDVRKPERGDVAVFRFPGDPSINYIKRVVGLPGDRIEYKGKRLSVNGQRLHYGEAKSYSGPLAGRLGRDEIQVSETIGDAVHDILITERPDTGPIEFTVPEDKYFVLGDNRDHSNDSRYWGFVPDGLLVGKAFFVWFSLDWSSENSWFWQRIAWARIGNSIQ